MAMNLIDEIEHLSTRLTALGEAEDLALQGATHMLPEIRKMIAGATREFLSLVRRMLRASVKMAARGPQVSIEALERLFIVLRDRAEIELARSLKLKGAPAKKARKKAEDFARLAQKAAESLKIATEATGRWSREYSQEHGLGPWVP